MRGSDAVGRYGERVAVAHLEGAGMVVLDRNWRCGPVRTGGLRGELDVVAMDGGCLVAVEVKTRRSRAYGDPVEAVTPVKAARLRRLVAQWLADHPDVRAERVRIDVVGVLQPRSGAAVVDHRRAVA